MMNREAEIEFTHQQILKQIVGVLSKITITGNRHDDTKQIKESLALLGDEDGFCVSCNGLSLDYSKKYKFVNREWLYDVTWYREINHYTIRSLDLAAEIEWGGVRYLKNKKPDNNDPYGEVKYDFQKLVTSRANIKLMVFIENHRESFKDLVNDYFQKQFDSFPDKHEDCFYLFCYYREKQPHFASYFPLWNKWCISDLNNHE